MIQIKRVYDPPAPEDGPRFLVERLWPRGMSKSKLPIEGWLKEVAPSPDLRRWYAHDLSKWDEFQRRYRAELDHHFHAESPLLRAAGRGNVTLLYSARDRLHNSALVLQAYLEERLERKHGTGK
jgi:uncharacterized protein YeaO (DUF488 family)